MDSLEFSQDLCMGLPGQGLAREGLFVFGGVGFLALFTSLTRHAWGRHTGLVTSSCHEGVHGK